MTHYICTGGCGTVSEHAGTCDVRDCMKYHNLLTVCHCQDQNHDEAYGSPNKVISEEGTHEI
jgi:hypothetical protein